MHHTHKNIKIDDNNFGNNENSSCALVDSGSALMARAVPSQTWAAPSWRRYAQYAITAWALKRNNQTAKSSGGGGSSSGGGRRQWQRGGSGGGSGGGSSSGSGGGSGSAVKWQ